MTADWQPIETAPRDGTIFLAWVSGLPYAARYDDYGRFIWYWHSDRASGPSHQIHMIDGKRLLEELKPREPAHFEINGHLWVNGFDAKPTHWMAFKKPAAAPVEARA